MGKMTSVQQSVRDRTEKSDLASHLWGVGDCKGRIS